MADYITGAVRVDGQKHNRNHKLNRVPPTNKRKICSFAMQN